MTVVTVHKPKTELSTLIQAAVDGEEVVIARGTRASGYQLESKVIHKSA